MSDAKYSSGGSAELAAVLWLVFTYGDPDLLDALIHWLMQP